MRIGQDDDLSISPFQGRSEVPTGRLGRPSWFPQSLLLADHEVLLEDFHSSRREILSPIRSELCRLEINRLVWQMRGPKLWERLRGCSLRLRREEADLHTTRAQARAFL